MFRFRHIVERIEIDSLRLFCPELADELVWREAAEVLRRLPKLLAVTKSSVQLGR
jgi:hypothetical protein